MAINYTKWGTACKIGDEIYLNPKLKAHPQLYKAIIRHEKQHSNRFTLKDLKMDLFGIELEDVKSEYYKFILTNPKTWIMFLPIWKYDKTWVLDLTILGLWLLGISLGGIIWRVL